MNIDDIEIHAGDIDKVYVVIGTIKAKAQAATAFSKTPTLEDVNFKLREVALKMGVNSIIKVEYSRGVSSTSWKALKATGVAVKVESDEKACPECAEIVKKAATKCKHCGAELSKPS